jgi:rubredoxin
MPLTMDCEVIMQKDSEGNGYSPLCGIAGGFYAANSSWSGDLYNVNWSCRDAGMEKEEWEEFKKNTPKVVVMYPIN